MTTNAVPPTRIEISVESTRTLPIKMYFFPTGSDINLESLKTARPMGDGSAFLYRVDGELYLVTAGHNFSAKHAGNDTFIGEYQTEPTHARVGLRPKPPPGGYDLTKPIGMKRVLLPLIDAEWNPLWYEHPRYGRRVDVAVLPFNFKDDDVLIDPWEAPLATPQPPRDPRLRPTEDVFIVGYPYGLSSGFDLPLWIRGTIASEPAFYWRSKHGQDLPLFLVDARTREGQSGSPVMFFRPPNTLFLSPEKQIGYTIGTQSKLLGVYSGRTATESDPGSSDLGFCWRIEEVNTICREHVRAAKLSLSGIGDDSEQAWFHRLSMDDRVTLFANPSGELSIPLVDRLALLPGGLSRRSKWVSDLSNETDTVRLSPNLVEQLNDQRAQLDGWWDRFGDDDRTYFIQHRDDELPSDRVGTLEDVSDAITTDGETGHFRLPPMVHVFVEWKAREQDSGPEASEK